MDVCIWLFCVCVMLPCFKTKVNEAGWIGSIQIILFFVWFLLLIDLKSDLVVGSVLIWAGLGCANVVAVIGCAIYLFTKLEWEDAIRESNARLRQTIDSAKGTSIDE